MPVYGQACLLHSVLWVQQTICYAARLVDCAAGCSLLGLVVSAAHIHTRPEQLQLSWRNLASIPLPTFLSILLNRTGLSIGHEYLHMYQLIDPVAQC